MAQDTTTSGFDAALKDVYTGPIRYQLNEKTRLLDLFTKGDIEQYEWEGRQAVLTLQKSRNAGTKATAEGGLLPAAGKQGFANLKVPMRFIEGRIELTTQLLKAARSDKGSFARAMDTEQKGLVNDLARQRNRMLAGFGQGTLAVVSAGVNNATQTLKDPGNIVGTVNVVRFVKPGMVVAFTDPTGVTIRGVQTILSVDSTNGQITLDAAVNTTTGDLISLGAKSGATSESSFGLEPMGILGLVDSTTFVSTIHTLDRSQAANAFFRSNILSSVGALSADVIQRGIDNTEEVSGEVIDQFLCHVSVRRELLKLTEADRRYTTDKMNPDAGTNAGQFKADLTHNNIPVKVDKDFAYGTLMGIVKEHLFYIPEVEGEWADEDGAVLSRVVDKDNYEARYRVFENFFSDQGNSHVRFDGVTATVTAAIFAD